VKLTNHRTIPARPLLPLPRCTTGLRKSESWNQAGHSPLEEYNQ